MSTLVLPDEVRAHVEEMERNAATWADQVMILRSKLEKAEFRLGEMTESRDEWRNQVEKYQGALQLLEGAARRYLDVTARPVAMIEAAARGALVHALAETVKATGGGQ
jgi:chromosome segregation ATPase